MALAQSGYVNLASGKHVTSSDPNPIIGSLKLLNDGQKHAGEGYWFELLDGLQWVQIDLEKSLPIHVIWIWHRSGMDTCIYSDVIVEISNDPSFSQGTIQVFNNDYDDSAGRGRGSDRPYTESNYGKAIQVNGVIGRYVRCYSQGNSWNQMNHYTEIEIFGLQSTVPVDPMSPTFKAFEADFWKWAVKERLAADRSTDLTLSGQDQIVIYVSGSNVPKTDETLARIMKHVVELWNVRMPGSPLRTVEIRSAKGDVLGSLSPKGDKSR